MNSILAKLLLYLSDLAQSANKLLNDISGFDLGSTRWEWWVAGFIVFVIFLSGFSYGKSKLFTSLLALYIAAVVEPLFIYFDWAARLLNTIDEYAVHIILFFVLYFIAFGLLNSSTIKSRFTLREFSLGPILLIAVLKFGFLVSIIMSYLPEGLTEASLSSVSRYFAAPDARFWWAILPIFGTIFLKPPKDSS